MVVLDAGRVSFVGRPQEWAAQPGLRPSSALVTDGEPELSFASSNAEAPGALERNAQSSGSSEVDGFDGDLPPSLRGRGGPLGKLDRAQSEPAKRIRELGFRAGLRSVDSLTAEHLESGDGSSRSGGRLSSSDRNPAPHLISEKTARDVRRSLSEGIKRGENGAFVDGELEDEILEARRASQEGATGSGRLSLDAVPLIEQEAREVGSVKWAIYRWVSLLS